MQKYKFPKLEETQWILRKSLKKKQINPARMLTSSWNLDWAMQESDECEMLVFLIWEKPEAKPTCN